MAFLHHSSRRLPCAFAALAAVTLSACASAPPATTTATAAPAAKAATSPSAPVLTLKMNESLTVPGSGMRVTFNGVRDSRCPTGLQCFAAGQVHADLWVEPQGEGPLQVTVAWGMANPAPGAPSQAAGHQFCFEDLSPRPTAGQAVPQADYRLRFRVLRLQPGAAANCDADSGPAVR